MAHLSRFRSGADWRSPPPPGQRRVRCRTGSNRSCGFDDHRSLRVVVSLGSISLVGLERSGIPIESIATLDNLFDSVEAVFCQHLMRAVENYKRYRLGVTSIDNLTIAYSAWMILSFDSPCQ